jgi:hypothetical protein
VPAFFTTDFIVRVLTFSQFDLQTVRRHGQRFQTIWRTSWLPAVLVLAILLPVCAAPAQQEKPKVPGLDKILNANEHLAYTGTVKSVDEKRNIISINSVEGGNTEVFPIKHSTHVETADGFHKKLDVLTPGTHVIVFYDQRADKRTVTRIELLASESKKEPQP